MRCLLLLVAMLFCSSVSALTLKIATISPDGTTWMQEMRKGADEISRLTQGRVAFRFYPGGVMGSDKQVLRKIRIGQLHGGAMTGGGLQEIYPDSQIYSLPFAFRSTDEVDYVRQHMDAMLTQGLLDKGFVSFGFAEGGFAYLMSGRPIRSQEDLKDHKVWVPEGDRVSQLAFSIAKVSPVSLPLPDVLTGLQTGLIDTIGASPIGAIALQWHTRIKYVTDIPLMYIYGILIVDRRVFDRVSPADQKIVKQVMHDVFNKLNQDNRRENGEARRALEAQGIEFIKPTGKNLQEWEDLMDNALVQNGSRLFTPKVLETLNHYLHDYRQSH